jgi:hypothetical protein
MHSEPIDKVSKNHTYSRKEEIDSICACMGIRSKNIDFFLGKGLRTRTVNIQKKKNYHPRETHSSCKKGTLMKASFESVEFSV